MKRLTIVLLATVLLNGCASTGQNWSLYEPYTPVQYNTPLVNSMVDSTVSIVRTQAEGYVAVKTLGGIIGAIY